MSTPSSSATNCGSEDSSANQPLLNPTSDRTSPVGKDQEKSAEHYPKHFDSPNINIGHVYVYNFSPAQPGDTVIEFPSPTDTIVKTKQAIISPGASSGPFCRICHEGDAHEDLRSPCFCTGTVGLVHLSCVEKWLGASGSDKCEICHYVFATVRYPKSFSEWVRSTPSGSAQRTFYGDLTCLVLLTPLAAVSSFLSIEGALKQIQMQNSIEAGSLMALATFLITVYFVWTVLTLRYHLKRFMKWRQRNQHVKILMVRRLSSTDGRFLSNQRPRNTCHPVGTPRTHQQSHPRLNLPTPHPGPVNANDVEANSASRENHGQYDFSRSDFIEHLTAMLETAL